MVTQLKFGEFLFCLSKESLIQICAADERLQEDLKRDGETFEDFIQKHNKEYLASVLCKTYLLINDEDELDEIIEMFEKAILENAYDYTKYEHLVRDFLYHHGDNLANSDLVGYFESEAGRCDDSTVSDVYSGLSKLLGKFLETNFLTPLEDLKKTLHGFSKEKLEAITRKDDMILDSLKENGVEVQTFLDSHTQESLADAIYETYTQYEEEDLKGVILSMKRM